MSRKRNNRFLLIIVSLAAAFMLCVVGFLYFKNSHVVNNLENNLTASWEVTLDEKPNYGKVEVDKNTQDYKIKITNTTKYDVVYSIVITNIPSGLRVELDDRIPYEPYENKIEIKNIGVIKYNKHRENVVEHVLSFSSVDGYKINSEEVKIDVLFTKK